MDDSEKFEKRIRGYVEQVRLVFALSFFFRLDSASNLIFICSFGVDEKQSTNEFFFLKLIIDDVCELVSIFV